MHNSVKPVLIEFHEAKERNDLYAACKEGLKKTGLVMTEDSRSQRILANFMKSQVTPGRERSKRGLEQVQLQLVCRPLSGLPHRPGPFQQDGPIDLKYTRPLGCANRIYLICLRFNHSLRPHHSHKSRCQARK